MIPKLDIPDGLGREAAERLQADLAARVVVEDRFGCIDTVAGLDVAYDKPGNRATAAIVVVRADDLSVVETRTLDTAVRFPYIPGLLSFRELPAICALLQQVMVTPDLLICDGQGIAHPRRFGLASHLGLLLDLPSVDREEDGGVLAAHHAFWDFPNTIDRERTISELLHVPAEVRDGDHLLELQVVHFMNDASPSRPLLYALLP